MITLEIPSFFYMQSIIDRRNRLFEIGKRIPEYKELLSMGCKFYDGFLLYDEESGTQLEINRLFLPEDVKNWPRATRILNRYVKVIESLYLLENTEHCIESARLLMTEREELYKQIIRERVFSGLRLYYHNSEGDWGIYFIDVNGSTVNRAILTKTTDKNVRKRNWKGNLNRMQLFLLREDCENRTRSIMRVEEIFDRHREEMVMGGVAGYHTVDKGWYNAIT